ncbi:16S rRNA (guanine527-N7)-methyltransferase [Desulfohalotomaculum tongense]|uniref:16S rRNA (guanine(527)-N(7))-methyltransferase RsmG n=1 Tax=Desulforadius tongensis TaxID=1216062 RepID=UPI00195E9F95|nr:16S rRNA (guanine(527)-N(7))-methyltransferase RsmG [Desulforadius tongensis]MBM7855822.1 16S rRNA (guanine527-N7)-methyltransferase [Desulforadius tongensis]
MDELLISTMLIGGRELGYSFTDNQLKQFNDYYRFLIETNKYINLTAITEPEEVAVKHFLDSMTCLSIVNKYENARIIDVGTGAGFPGVVLKICSSASVVLLDSLRKRVDFLNRLVEKLQLENIKAVHGRAEDFGKDKDYRARYDLVVSRAVAHLAVLSEYCLPLIKVGGTFVAMKGSKAEKEIEEAKNAVSILGGRIVDIKELKLPVTGNKRTIVEIKKVLPTPDKYPRRAGVPAKKPLK